MLAKCCMSALLLSILCGCGGGGDGATDASATEASSQARGTSEAISGGDELSRRLIVGYQGWFGCPGDLGGNSQWVHWFNGAPSADHFVVDMLPDVSALDPADTCDTGLVGRDRQPVRVFSSQNRNVVDYHFSLMAAQGVGGVALQRFVSELGDANLLQRRDNVLANVMWAADRHRVPFFLSYDVTGADPATVVSTIRADWRRLDSQMRLTERDDYLHDHGKPVIELWGFGFNGNPGTPAEVKQLLVDLKSGSAGLPAATVIGGVPSHWRTLDGDAQADPAWRETYLAFDVLSPWTVGRYSDAAGAESFFGVPLDTDVVAANAAGIRYLPVIFPGFSWYNLMKARGDTETKWINDIPRECGEFLMHQADLLVARHFDSLYIAMFDEVDEGTALLPAQVSAEAFPPGFTGVSLDEDGCGVASTGYVTATGNIAASLRSGVQPSMP